ncbi:unnamed protein product, partial [Polarella glacialis]
VLRILEHFLDEVEDSQDDKEVDPSAEKSSGSPRVSLSRGSLYALLAYLEDQGSALHALLAAALGNDEDEAVREAAARIYLLCAAGPEVPSPLQSAVRDLAPTLAEAVVSSCSRRS